MEYVEAASNQEADEYYALVAGGPRSTRRTADLPPRLNRVFAGLELDEESILRFANKHGVLGVPTEPVPSGKQSRRNAEVGEMVDAWLWAIRRMKMACGLWDAVKKPRSGRLKELMCWKDHTWSEGTYPAAFYTGLHGGEVPGDNCTPLDLVGLGHEPVVTSGFDEWQCEPPYLVKPARVLLQAWINEGMRQPQWSRKGSYRQQLPSIVTVLEMDTATGLFHIRQQARTLLSAMWLQFAAEVTGRVQDSVRTTTSVCAICGSDYEAQRSTAAYCSAACKQKAYRARRQADLQPRL
jgi:hypothetical protein